MTGDRTWRCLTVRQWWVWAMGYGGKHVENRGPGALAWKHRGLTALHAAKEPDQRLRGRLELAESHGPQWARMAPPTAGPSRNVRYASELELARAVAAATPDSLRAIEVYSAILATAELVDVHRSTPTCCRPWGEAAYVWAKSNGPATHLVFEEVEPVWPPIDCRGALGLWLPPPEVLVELRKERAAT